MQMREIIKLLEQAGDSSRLGRSVFLYLESRREDSEFAQCSSCSHWLPESGRCALFSDDDEVIANASCGLYTQGKPQEDQPIRDIMTPEDAGYLVGQVRCENCSWADGVQCGFFRDLNSKMSDVFDLDTDISPKGCCNAWQPASS